MNLEQLKTFLENNILIPFFCFLTVAFLFYILCEIAIQLLVSSYFGLQKFLIKKSSPSNKGIFGKLLVVNYRIYRSSFRLLMRIEPFHFEDRDSEPCFQPTLCSPTTKRNLPCILICLGISVVVNLVLNNVDTITSVFNRIFAMDISSIGAFFSEYKWLIIAAGGMLILLYGVLKDKFTNDIITKIHDQELKNILVTHKDIYADFIRLRNCLVGNIGRFLNSYKDDGIPFFLHESISHSFNHFEYDTKKRSFIARSTKSHYCPPLRSSGTYGYENISDITAKMKQRLKVFKDTKPFYSTAVLNKYIPGLSGFDISRAIRGKDEKHLLCEEILESICKKYPDHVLDFVKNEDFDEEFKINQLNDLLSTRSLRLIDVVSDSIEYAIELERYINKFSKAFALKTRRNDFPAEKMIDRYK